MEDGANPYVIIGILACLAIAELIGEPEEAINLAV